MQKSNREVRDQEELLEIINDCKVCRLGMVDNGMPYVIPMNFGYTSGNQQSPFISIVPIKGKKLRLWKRTTGSVSKWIR